MTQNPNKPYIVVNENGEEFLLPCYSAPFRVLMDDKDTIRDVLNSVLQLDAGHEIVDLEYEFEKPIDVFMPENDPARLDVWVTTRDHRYLNIEMQNKMHPFFLDRMQLYNAYLTLRGKYDFNRSDYFMNMKEKERKFHFYELPETFSIWLCNFPILGDKDVYKDIWAVYSEHEVNTGKALPLLTKNKYIVVDLPNFLRLREGVRSREDFWLRLISKGPLQVPATEDPLFLQALNRLRVSRVKPELLKHMEANMSDHHAFDAIMAEAWLKGEAQGMAQGEAKGEAKGEARTLSVFRDLGVSPEKIAEAKARLAALSSK